MTTEVQANNETGQPLGLGCNEGLGLGPARDLLVWLLNDFERGTSSRGCELVADEIKRLRAALAAFLPFAPGMYGNDKRSDEEIDAAKAAAFELAAEVLGPNVGVEPPKVGSNDGLGSARQL